METEPRVGLLWRREWDPPSAEPPKLHGVFAAFAELGVEAEGVVYSDDEVDAVREQLLPLDAVLVWVNPIELGQGGEELDRSKLDPLLREVADAGVFVSAHPDVILRMGTKEVLVDTREMGWGTDTRIYRSWEELRAALPARIADGSAVVLKQHRGMGGLGVWKVELGAGEGMVIAQHAARGAAPEEMSLGAFLEQWKGHGLVVEQPYQQRLPEGLRRAYLTHDRVVGFTHQYVLGLIPSGVELPKSSKTFDPPDDPRYADLRERVEEWVPEMQQILGIATHELPVIWDADFLRGDNGGYILCEINVSSTFAFPDIAMPGVARATLDRIRGR